MIKALALLVLLILSNRLFVMKQKQKKGDSEKTEDTHTDAKFAIEPEPRERSTLHLRLSTGSSIVVDAMEHTATHDSNGNSEEYQTKDQAQDELLPFADMTSPEDCYGQPDDFKRGLATGSTWDVRNRLSVKSLKSGQTY